MRTCKRTHSDEYCPCCGRWVAYVDDDTNVCDDCSEAGCLDDSDPFDHADLAHEMAVEKCI